MYEPNEGRKIQFFLLTYDNHVVQLELEFSFDNVPPH